jgi:hypothetical protein
MTRRTRSATSPALLVALLASAGTLAVALAPAFALGADGEPAAIRIDNYAPGETIRYPVALLVGSLADKGATEVALANASSTRPTKTMRGQADGGTFKVLADLVPGENKLTVSVGPAAAASLVVTYKPQTNPYVVRAVYMTDAAGGTDYNSPLPNDPQDYADKFDTAMKLMQAFTAERMRDLGYGRRTFNLELGDDGKVKVHVVRGKRPAADYYAMNDQAWYAAVLKEMDAAFADHDRGPNKGKAKNVVLAAYTRFNRDTGKPQGHTALGGGNQGLFGSGNVFTWPSTLAEVQPAFSNAARMDKSKAQDDSGGRGTFWAAASTTIGATLHEMGHTFDLPHTTVRTDVMTRGFDYFNRAFTVVEPGRRPGDGPKRFKPDEVAAFAPVSAESLLTSRWFALDDRAYADRNDVKLSLDPAGEAVLVRSAVGVRYLVAVTAKGEAAFHQSPPRDVPAPAEFRVPLADVRRAIPDGDVSFRAVDADGFTARAKLSRLREQAKPAE